MYRDRRHVAGQRIPARPITLSAMDRRIRDSIATAAGGLFGLAAVVVWAGGLGWFADPAPPTFVEDPGRPNWATHPYAQDLRWAAIVFGVTGLLLVVRRSRWRVPLVATAAAAWFAADSVVRGTSPDGWFAASAYGLGLAALMTLAVMLGWRTPRATPLPADAVATIASVVVGCVSLSLPFDYDPEYYPAAALEPVGRVLGATLVVAAVVVAAVVGRLSVFRIPAMVGPLAVFVLGAYGTARFGLADDVALLAGIAALAGFVVCLAVLADPVGPRRGRFGLYLTLVPGLTLIMVPLAYVGTTMLAVAMSGFAFGRTWWPWPFYDEWYSGTLIMLMTGLVLGVLAALPTLAPAHPGPGPRRRPIEPSTVDDAVAA